MSETRKPAATLDVDSVCNGRLAGANDERTLPRLCALRSDLIDPPPSWPCRRLRRRRNDRRVPQRGRRRALAIEVQSAMVDRNAYILTSIGRATAALSPCRGIGGKVS